MYVLYVWNTRYCIKVRVHGGTGNAIFVIFEKDGVALLNKTALELFEAEDKVCVIIFVLFFYVVTIFIWFLVVSHVCFVDVIWFDFIDNFYILMYMFYKFRETMPFQVRYLVCWKSHSYLKLSTKFRQNLNLNNHSVSKRSAVKFQSSTNSRRWCPSLW